MSIIVNHVSCVFDEDSNMPTKALKDINLVINEGEFIGLIGHTGSGKSTLVQHLNGLIKATEGAVYFNGEDIYDKDFDKKKLRSKVVFRKDLWMRRRKLPEDMRSVSVREIFS